LKKKVKKSRFNKKEVQSLLYEVQDERDLNKEEIQEKLRKINTALTHIEEEEEKGEEKATPLSQSQYYESRQST